MLKEIRLIAGRTGNNLCYDHPHIDIKIFINTFNKQKIISKDNRSIFYIKR